MLYIIGGASRSGKTLLARKVVAEKQIPYFPLDSLFSGLAYGAPGLGVRYEDSQTERPEKIWPVLSQMLGFFQREEKDFLVEGDSILPSQVKELIDGGLQTKACFLGYPTLSKDEKLNLIRTHHQGEADWTKDISDEEMLKLIDENITFSKYLEEECIRHDIKYFDISLDFHGPREMAYSYLFSN